MINGEAGQAIFQKAYEVAKAANASPPVAYASAWCALEKIGYMPDQDGVWQPPAAAPEVNFSAEISKMDDEKRIVYGWASVIEEGGKTVKDYQGDSISADELMKAAHDFITSSRAAKAMHEGDQIGDFVESIVFTQDVQKALGIDLKKIGWFVGFRVNNDEVWAGVKSGKYKMLSIGGRGKRVVDNGA